MEQKQTHYFSQESTKKLIKISDKFLIIIVGSILMIVIIAFAIILLKPETSYKSKNTPEGIVHDYTLALTNEDYKRAYTYISTKNIGFPKSLEKFVSDVQDKPYYFNMNRVSITSIETIMNNKTEAKVNLYESVFVEGELFGSSQYIRTVEFDLVIENSEWKIKYANNHFAKCWRNAGGCRK